MPPTRRRRPVQPATRVRLPRATRSHPPETANATAGAGPADVNVDEAEPGTEASTDEATTGVPEVEQGDEKADSARWPSNRRREDEADTADEADKEPGDDEAVKRPAAAREERGRRWGASAGAGREPLLLPVCLGVATVMLGGLAIWFGLNTGSGSSPSSGFGTGTTNMALVNAAATNQVNQQIDNAVDTIFSYNYTDTAKTANAARDLLTGKASGEYATLFKVVQQDAPSEKLVLTTTVTNSGVEMLNGDTARLLIFANQKDTGAAKGSTTDAGAMFAVTAVHQDGRWKIEDINTFSGNG
jgi:Mce-associated membrane protein